MPKILVPASGGSFAAYLATPTDGRTVPGILVVPDALGVDTGYYLHADQMAEAGFQILAVDPGQLGGTLCCLRSLARDLIQASGPAFADLQTCRAWLADRPGNTGKVGFFGFCIASGFALMLVQGSGVACPASGSPKRLPDEVEDFLRKECPALAGAGKSDVLVEVVARELERSLERALGSMNAKDMPDAELMFRNDERVFWFRLVRLPLHPPDESTRQKFHRTVADFFRTHLAS